MALLANTDRWLETGVPTAVTVAIVVAATVVGVVGAAATAVRELHRRSSQSCQQEQAEHEAPADRRA